MGVRPGVLEETVSSGEPDKEMRVSGQSVITEGVETASRKRERRENLPVEGIIGITLLTESTAESVSDVGTSHLSLFVDFGNVDLNRSVIFGDDQSVGGRALAGDVKVDNLSLIVLHDVLACLATTEIESVGSGSRAYHDRVNVLPAASTFVSPLPGDRFS